MDYKKDAMELLKDFKGKNYLYGRYVLKEIGSFIKITGKKAIVIRGSFPGSDNFLKIIRESLQNYEIKILKEVYGAKPNTPKEDVFRIRDELADNNPDLLISFGGGSIIDAVKAAEVLRQFDGGIEDYFGTGKVTEAVKSSGKKLTDHIAIQTAASSGAHLTKYANITDVKTGQKKLIVDDAIIPKFPVFDYSVTYNAPKTLTMDGALDSISHCLEVFYGASGKDNYEHIKKVAQSGIGLVVENLPKVIKDTGNKEARDSLCLGADMGAYAIMLGGTNGGHLTSFSLVDILSHGRACAIMNPYYTVFFAPAIEDALRTVGNIYKEAGFTDANFEKLSGRELGEEVAKAMINLSKEIGFPTKLNEVEGFTREHIERAIKAAKNPQLKMKLQNMPVPLDATLVDKYMRLILEAAADGDFSKIKNIQAGK